MILDADSLELAPAVEILLKASGKRTFPGSFKAELFASVVEATTGICTSVGDAMAELRALRRTAAEVAEENDLRMAAAGSHPISVPEEQTIAPEERYASFVEYAGISARRQGVSGLHVHVGIPDRDSCLRALEGVLPWLPLVLALSANSPYLAAGESGHLSVRAEVLALLPRRGAPPHFASWAEWERHLQLFVNAGLVRDYTQFWWDARPHPRFGTLEVRMPDQPTQPALAGFFAALVQALVATVVERAPQPPIDRGVYDQNRWAALHRGPRAELLHPDEERLAGVPELLAELLGLVEPAARRLGTWELLHGHDATACEADRQLAVGRSRGLAAVCADLVERSVPSG